MTGIVSQIAAFIRAQLDEDEQAARDATPGPWTAKYGDLHVMADSRDVPDARDVVAVVRQANFFEDVIHIARHDPARVLRRVGGMREILNSYDTAVRELDRALMRARAHARVGVPDDIQATLTRNLVKVVALENVVLRLSLEYVDHDGYLDEWKQFTRPLAR